MQGSKKSRLDFYRNTINPGTSGSHERQADICRNTKNPGTVMWSGGIIAQTTSSPKVVTLGQQVCFLLHLAVLYCCIASYLVSSM